MQDKNKKLGFEQMQKTMDEIDHKYNNLEDVTNQTIVQNGKLFQDNKLLLMEILKHKQMTEQKFNQLMMIFGTFMNNQGNRNIYQQINNIDQNNNQI